MGIAHWAVHHAQSFSMFHHSTLGLGLHICFVFSFKSKTRDFQQHRTHFLIKFLGIFQLSNTFEWTREKAKSYDPT